VKHISFRTIFASIVFVLGIVSVNVTSTFAATTAVLSGSPAHVTAPVGQQYRVTVRLTLNGASVDTVNIVAHYQTAYASFVGLDNAGTSFDAPVPATPTAQNGQVTFSKASLSKGPVSGDVVVGTLIFNANTSTGTDTVRFDGSEIARDGKTLALTTTPVQVTYSSSSSTSAGPVISNIGATGVTVNGGSVKWHTNVPATSSVEYGTTAKYGLSSGSSELVTDHQVALDTVFAGKSVVYYQITSTSANGQSTKSPAQSFTTAGYTVRIHVANKDGKSLHGAQVKVSTLPAVTTDSNGYARVTNVAPGNQKVVINDGGAQFITVKSPRGAQATKVQDFNLIASAAQPVYWYFLVPLLLAALALLWLASRRSNRKNS